MTLMQQMGRNGNRMLVFIDARVDCYQQLVHCAKSNTEIFILASDTDGVAAITQTLQQQHVCSVHIVAHGHLGCLMLGNTELSLHTLTRYAQTLKNWFSNAAGSLAPSLVLYGCNVAIGDAGIEFVEKLHQITGATVRASRTLVGHESLGGNWNLEVCVGSGSAPIAFHPQVAEAYAGVLPSYPDGDGYYRYVTNDASFNSIKSTGTRIYKATDQNAPAGQPKFNENFDGEVGLALPFSFNYYGTLVTDITVGINGGIIPGTQTGVVSPNNAFLPIEDPQTRKKIPGIFPYWADLDLSKGSGDVYFQAIGAPGNRTFVIEWNNVAHVTAGDGATFQVILHEGSNEIDFIYSDVSFNNANYDNGKDASIGLSGVDGIQYSVNEPSLDGIRSIRFVPDPRIVTNAIASQEGQELILTNQNLKADDFDTPANNVTYTVTNIQNATFKINNVPVTTFTQDDINNSRVKLIHDGSENAPSFDFAVNDPYLSPAPKVVSAQITFTKINDAPTLSGVNASLTVQENAVNATPVLIDADVTLTDPDSIDFNGGQLIVSYVQGGSPEDQLSIRTGGLVNFDGSLVQYSNVTIGSVIATTNGVNGKGLVVSFNASSTREAVEAVIEHLTYQNISHTPNASRSISIVVTDGDGGTSTAVTLPINVTAENDAPVITIPAAQTLSEDTPLAFTGDRLISITDMDAGNNWVRVVLTATNGVLGVGTGVNITAGATNTGSITMQDTVGNINAALDNLIFTPKSNFNGAASVKIDVDDLGNSGANGNLTDSKTVNLTVGKVNDAPINTVPSAQLVNEDTNLIFSGANAIVINDVDAGEAGGSGNLDVILSVQHGRLSLSSTTGLQLPIGTGTGDQTIRIVGTQSNINTALNGLVYRADQNFNGADALTITTSDLGNTGSGNVLTDIDTVAITVKAVNDVPVNTVPTTGQTVNEDTDLVFSTATGNAIAIADVDAAEGSNKVRVTLSVSNGTLTLNGNLSPLTFLDQDGRNDSTMTFEGTVAAINTALNGLIYRGNLNAFGSDTLTLTTNDLGNFGSGPTGSTSSSVAIAIAPINDAPVLSGVISSLTFDEQVLNASAQIIDDSVSFSDVDSANFDGGLLRVTYNAGSLSEDQLSIRNQGTGTGLIGVNANLVTYGGSQIGTITANGSFGSNLEITLTANATIEAVKALIQNLTYRNTSEIPSSSRTIAISVNDGDGGTSTPVYTLITTTPYNDAPVKGNNKLTITEGQRVEFDSTNLSATDVDSNLNQLVFEAVNVQGGYFLIDGVRKNSFTQQEVTSSKVEFQHDGGEAAPSYEILIKDEINIVSAGTAQIQFTNVNDAPTLLGLTNLIEFSATEANGQPALIDSSVSFADVDSANFDGGYLQAAYSAGGGLEDQLAIRHQGVEASQIGVNGTAVFFGGTQIGSIDSSKTGTNGATLQVHFNAQATVAGVKALIENLTYHNTSDTPSESRTIAIIVNDGDGGISDAAKATISIAPENDPPTIIAPISGTINEDGAFTFSGSNLIRFDDPDAGSSPVQVTLTATHGSLTLSGASGLSFLQGDGVGDSSQAFTGSLVDINKALDGAVFNLDANFNGVATVQVKVDDLGNTGHGGAKTDVDTVSITVNAINDAPQIQVNKNQAVNEDENLIFSGSNRFRISDVDSNGLPARASLSVQHGTLTLNGNVTGLKIISGSLSSNAVVFEGTIADINAALDGLVYRGNNNFNGSDVLALEVEDLGNSGSSGSLKANANVDITVRAVNDAPVNTVPTAQSVNEEAPLLFSDSTGNAIRVADVDLNEGTGVAQMSLTVAHGSFTLAQTDDLSFTNGDGTTDTAMTFSGSAEAINAALNGLVYQGNLNFFGQDTLTVTTSDRGNTGQNGALLDVDKIGITVNNVNDAPILAGNPATVIDVAKFYSFVPTAGDVDGDRLTFSINNKPAWATFNPATGQLSGVPGDADVGVLNNIVISVSDSVATANLSPFNLTVLDGKIKGTSSSDQLIGDNVNNVILGLTDNDFLNGLDGNDTLYGDEGDDQLSGENGNDTLYGSVGNDKLDGGNGDDISYGEDGNDQLLGSAGRDTLYGGNNNDLLMGGKDNDRLYGDTNNDKLYGNEGNDILIGGQGNDRMEGGIGNDKLLGGAGKNILDGGSGRDVLVGGSSRDVFVMNRDGLAIIRDFKVEEDRLAILGENGRKLYSQLGISQSGRDTIIEFNDQTIGKLIGVDADQIIPKLFTRV